MKISDWSIETRVSKKLKEFLDGMWTYYRYEEVELFGQPYLKVKSTGMSGDYWPQTYFCRRWVHWQQDKSPIDVCNISSDGTFYVAEIYKRSWNTAPWEWKKRNREIVGY